MLSVSEKRPPRNSADGANTRHFWFNRWISKLNSSGVIDRDAFVAQEAARCLECNYVCSKCVDVCPNRANVSIAVPGFQNRFQTLHLDAYCNECGNCAQFCPWNGKPYKDKITVFSLAQDFDNSSNPGFLVEDCRVRVRLNNQSWVLNIDSKGQFNNVPPELNDMCRIISHVHQHHHYLLGRVEV